MKNYQIAASIIVCILLLFVFMIGNLEFNLLLPTNPFRFSHRTSIVFLSLFISFIGIFMFSGKLWKILHMIWMFPLFYLFFLFLLNTWSLRNLDYLFAKQQKFRVEQVFENKWVVNSIIIEKTDTIYFSQNLRWIEDIDEVLLTRDNLINLEVRKSRLQNYYHLSLKNEIKK